MRAARLRGLRPVLPARWSPLRVLLHPTRVRLSRRGPLRCPFLQKAFPDLLPAPHPQLRCKVSRFHSQSLRRCDHKRLAGLAFRLPALSSVSAVPAPPAPGLGTQEVLNKSCPSSAGSARPPVVTLRAGGRRGSERRISSGDRGASARTRAAARGRARQTPGRPSAPGRGRRGAGAL